MPITNWDTDTNRWWLPTMVNVMIYILPFYVITIAVEIGLSYFKNRKGYGFQDTICNLGLSILCQFSELLFGGMALFFYIECSKYAISLRHYWQGPIAWGIIFVLVDFLYYWFHRHSHLLNFFWSIHKVHHSSEYFNLTVALRNPFFSRLVSTMYYLPLALIGIPFELFIICYLVNINFQYCIHTEFIKKIGILEYIFNTPSHHRVHHSRQKEFLNCNFGGTLIIWDRLFNTFIPEEKPILYGTFHRLRLNDPIMANLDPLIKLFKRNSHKENTPLQNSRRNNKKFFMIFFVLGNIFAAPTLLIPTISWYLKCMSFLFTLTSFQLMASNFAPKSVKQDSLTLTA